jgi:hypothetical protein
VPWLEVTTAGGMQSSATTTDGEPIRWRWIPITETPPPEGRLLICRNINGNRYVDLIAYVPDEPCGLPPLPTLKHVTHWMYPPEAPNG